MEHFKQGERSKNAHESQSGIHRHNSGHREVFNRDGESYEEVSFLYEPMEKYQDDLMRLELVITHKKQILQDAEERLRVHAAVPTSAMHLLQGGIADKVAYIKKEIHRWEAMRLVTLQRFSLLAKQDQHEQDVLDGLSTRIEH